jgi:hypothetical protein
VVETPLNEVLIDKLTLPPTIVRLPPEVGEVVNLVKSYPYAGVVCAVPTVLNPAKVLSCQYFKTPVT